MNITQHSKLITFAHHKTDINKVVIKPESQLHLILNARKESKSRLNKLGVLNKHQPDKVEQLFEDAFVELSKEEKIAKLVRLANLINLATITMREHFITPNQQQNIYVPRKMHLMASLIDLGIHSTTAIDVLNCCIHEGSKEKHGIFGFINNYHTGSIQTLYDNMNRYINLLKSNKNVIERPDEVISHLSIKKYLANQKDNLKDFTRVNNLLDQSLFNQLLGKHAKALLKLNSNELPSPATPLQTTKPTSHLEVKTSTIIEMDQLVERAKNKAGINTAVGFGEFANKINFTNMDELFQFVTKIGINNATQLGQFASGAKINAADKLVELAKLTFNTNDLALVVKYIRETNVDDVSRFIELIGIDKIKFNEEIKTQQINQIKQELNPISKRFFVHLLDSSTINKDTPILAEGIDGSHVRLAVLAIQTDKLMLNDCALSYIANLMNEEVIFLKSGNHNKWQSNKKLQEELRYIAKNAQWRTSEHILILKDIVFGNCNLQPSYEFYMRVKLKKENMDCFFCIKDVNDAYESFNPDEKLRLATTEQKLNIYKIEGEYNEPVLTKFDFYGNLSNLTHQQIQEYEAQYFQGVHYNKDINMLNIDGLHPINMSNANRLITGYQVSNGIFYNVSNNHIVRQT